MSYKYPNVDLSYPGFHIEGKEIAVQPFLAQFVDAIAVKYPAWLLIGTNGTELDNHVSVRRFKVMNDKNPREEVGIIGVGHRYANSGQRELVFEVSCHRLTMARDRGSCLRTKELKVAMKAVKQHFTPLPVAEQLDEVRSKACDFVRSTSHRYGNELTTTRSKLYPLMQHYVRNNLQAFMATLATPEQELMNTLLEQETAFDCIKTLEKDISSDKVLTVLTQDDKYVVRYDGRISVWDSEELPYIVRQRIGMLKLTDPNIVVEGVGMKTKQGFVVVLPPEGFVPDKEESSDAVPKV